MTKPATAPKVAAHVRAAAPAATGGSAQASAPRESSADSAVESSAEVVHNIKRRAPAKFKTSIYGVGDVKTIFIKGVDPLAAVKLKIDNLPGGVTIMGVESGDGVINLRWSSSVAVNAVITGTVTL